MGGRVFVFWLIVFPKAKRLSLSMKFLRLMDPSKLFFKTFKKTSCSRGFGDVNVPKSPFACTCFKILSQPVAPQLGSLFSFFLKYLTSLTWGLISNLNNYFGIKWKEKPWKTNATFKCLQFLWRIFSPTVSRMCMCPAPTEKYCTRFSIFMMR